MPTLYIISGCNGAGKTTASFTLLPEMLNCREFVNADSIAAGISPFQPEKVAFEAGRMMLERINQLIRAGTDFAFETTLSTKSYREKIKHCKKKGYKIILLYFWLSSPLLAIERIKGRVRKGGHFVPDHVVKRRYERGLINLFRIFIPEVDSFFVINNSGQTPSLIAKGGTLSVVVYDRKTWNQLKSFYDENE